MAIRRLNARIATLERRAEHLEGRIRQPERREASLAFDKSELAAIEAGLEALRLHRAMLEPETSPVLILDELVTAYDAADGILDVVLDPRFGDALKRARKTLVELGERDAA
jgi:hypothetical protein